MTRLFLVTAIVASVTAGMSIFIVLDTPNYIDTIRGEITGFRYGGGKIVSRLNFVRVHLENGSTTEFPSDDVLPPKNGKCVEFRHFQGEYSKRNTYRLLRFC
jgi:hypothetical protein